MALENLIEKNYFFTEKVISASNRLMIPIPIEQQSDFKREDKVLVINLDRKKNVKN